VSTEKKVPPRHRHLYIGDCSTAYYRKPKVVRVSFFFCIRKFKRYIFASVIWYSKILIFSSRKFTDKSKVQHIRWYKLTVVFTNYFGIGMDAQWSDLCHRFFWFDLYIINQKLFLNRFKILMKKSQFFIKNGYFPL
jgi:hypothetical protein